MDDWRIQQQQQQQQRMTMNNIGPIHNYHSMRSRPSPYQYQQPSVKTDSNPVSQEKKKVSMQKILFFFRIFTLLTHMHLLLQQNNA